MSRKDSRERKKGVSTLQRRRAEAAARSAPNVNRLAIRALRNRPHDRFFLYLHYMDVHDYVLGPDPYWAMVIGFDRDLANLLETLEGEGLLEDTFVILTADHGEALDEKHALPGTEGHLGNPSFEPLLRVPLIVAPPAFEDTTGLVRSQDVPGLIKHLAGLRPDPGPASPAAVQPGELFLSEARYQTYRRGRWKSTWPRGGGKPYLFDLEEDPGELRNLAATRADVARRHRARIDDLAKELATKRGLDSRLSGRDRGRLRALGYVE